MLRLFQEKKGLMINEEIKSGEIVVKYPFESIIKLSTVNDTVTVFYPQDKFLETMEEILMTAIVNGKFVSKINRASL